jgi:hypothetical protein
MTEGNVGAYETATWFKRKWVDLRGGGAIGP